ncbi:hypothetical protein BKA66DRAFT_151269 [Pyrenochaeta sp. MPI-SDFR-AT-0127]|nr:hypothetical protein BKA66DRAFT_151269 [Pyrenochaeta sp. MPI-SDFR-AT-0127]
MGSSTALAIQSWILHGTGISFIISRIIFRRITLHSFRKLQADDWLMVFALIPFTAAVVLANQISDGQSQKERKFRYVLEELQIVTIWLVKACLLVLYWRIFPMETSAWKKRALKGISAFCCISFLVVQISLISWCRPMEAHWDPTPSNSQCATFHKHTAVTLTFDIPNTIFIMMLPVAFIPTPRRLLLAILFILGTLVFISGIVSRAALLKNVALPAYLHWYTSESTLSIIFANLPFLTSFFVATAPAKLRGFSQNLRTSSQLALSQWPRSRRGSWECRDASRRGSWATHNEGLPPLRVNRLGSAATTISELSSPVDMKKAPEWSMSDDHMQTTTHSRNTSSSKDSGKPNDTASLEEVIDAPPSTSALTPLERISLVPKTRLSGGLAEMGDVSINNTEGWPIYWK